MVEGDELKEKKSKLLSLHPKSYIKEVLNSL